MPNSYPKFDSSTYNHLATFSYRSKAVYLAAMLGIILLLVSLPLVRMSVSAQAPGMLRPLAEKTEVRPLVAGTITKLLVRENQQVQAGDTLLLLQSGAMQSQLALNARQQAEHAAFVQDLAWLVQHMAAPAGGLRTPLYGQQAAQYQTQLQQFRNQLQKSSRDVATSQELFRDKVIARVELEDKTFAHRKRLDEARVLTETQRSQWQAELASHRAALAELRGQQQQLGLERRLYCLRAPVTGTVQQLAGKYVGSYVQSGELLGTLSPDGDLLAECYVSPKDIGFMRVGMPARFQVDAFDYNQWGLVEGRITDVSRDFVLVNNEPVFKVRCQLSRAFLQLDNGYRGTLRKSMTVHARFLLARRTLWQLLFDRADNWLNPTQDGVS
ncbi:HlyD family secretion protein [Hymenobacter elongatus]|uniref:HlyD family efflux transporter periplasmic adaptor subunit n=1 Tax=Hymenobacter elongatus TaxID=877208 RepID=A0A4Z0PP38_9BACT|nr:HlyD family efflux transporter periplasmic adaptor subunit [Hymenobacter elongatus]TGE17148.1 HlyD family efflux transporter periplasmic adaptor subunit [Hymenobacter elongatus]